MISPHFTRFVYESVKGSSETSSGGPLIVTTMRKHPVWDKRARLSIRAKALMVVSFFLMSTQKGGEYHVNESICFMDPDVFVFQQQICGEDGPVPFRNHCLLPGDKDSGRVWTDGIAGNSGDFCFQQSGGAFCYHVSSPLPVRTLHSSAHALYNAARIN